MDFEPSSHGQSVPARGFAGKRRPGPAPDGTAFARRRPAASAIVLRWVAGTLLVAYFAAGLAYLGLRHLVWPHPERWLPHVEQAISAAFGRAVQIGPVTAGFDGLRPSLEIEGFSILEDDGSPVLAARRVHAALSLTSLATGRLRFAHLEIDSPVLTVERLEHRRIRVAGIVIDRDSPGADGSGAEWLLAQRRIVLRDARLDWIDRVAGRSLTVSRADLAIGNVGRRHRASLHVEDLPGVGRGLDLAIELHRPVFSRIRDWRSWDAELHLGAEQLGLSVLATLFDGAPLPGHLAAWSRRLGAGGGLASLRVWAGLEQGGALDGMVKLGVSGARFDFGAGPLGIDELAIEARFGRDDTGIELRLDKAQLRASPDAALRTRSDSDQRIRLDSMGRLVSAGLSFERLEAATLRTLAASLPWPDGTRERIDALSLAGSIDGLSVEWLEPSRASDSALASGQSGPLFSIEARIEDLSIAAAPASGSKGVAALPSVTNLSGSVFVSESSGSLSLASRRLMLRIPDVFAEPAIPLDSLDGVIAWRWVAPPSGAAASLQIATESLRFSAPDAAGEFSGRYLPAARGPAEIELTGRLERADATRVARYLPLTVPAEVRRWVAGSITAGRSDDVRFRMRGRVEDFPFRDPALGEFRIEAALRDVRLEYAPEFPPIERIRGRLVFERAGMDFRADSAQIWGVALGAVRAGIDDLLDPRLRVQGGASGPARDLLRFVNESPIRHVAGEFTGGLGVDGEASLRLGLQIPLEDIDSIQVAGAVELPGNRIVLSSALPEVSEVRGRIEFSESALALRRLSGNFLGSPLRVEGEMTQAGVLRVTALGRTSSQAIRRLLDHPFTRALDGEAAWRAEFDLGGEGLSVRLQSDLVGLGSGLPEPFAKLPADAWPLRVLFRPLRSPQAGAASPGESVRVLLRDDIGLEFERRRDPRTGSALAGRGVLSVGAPLVLPADGFAVRIDVPMLDVDSWTAVIAAAPPGGTVGSTGTESSTLDALILPTEWSLIVDSMRFAGKQLNEVVLGGTRRAESWQANIHSREIDGHFSWRGAAPGRPVGALDARFRRLEIPSSRIEEVASLIDSAPSTLPALDITAEEFVLKDRKLGQLSLKASSTGTPQAPVWHLDRLRIDHPSATLLASGDWKAPRGVLRRSTSLEIDLAVRDSGRLLGVFGLADTMSGAAGSVKGRLGWIGSPLSIDLPTLGGDIGISLGPGAFLRTDPGFAKLIGVVSLQSLRRRLAFDFRDLFAEGFAFDSIDGRARLAGGVLSTEDFSIRGLAAQVAMTGSANLVDETQSLQVEVRPDINAGLASLAYAALANPAVGIGSFIAQWVLRKPLQQLFAWQYEVTGSWTEPQVVTRGRPQIDATPSGG